MFNGKRQGWKSLPPRVETLNVLRVSGDERFMKGEMDVFPRRAEAYFLDYLKRSSFPEMFDWESEGKISEHVRNSVIDRSSSETYHSRSEPGTWL